MIPVTLFKIHRSKEMMEKISDMYLSGQSKYHPDNLRLGRSIMNDYQDACANAMSELPEFMEIVREKKVHFEAVVGFSGPMSSCIGYLAHLLDTEIINFCTAGPYTLHLQEAHLCS